MKSTPFEREVDWHTCGDDFPALQLENERLKAARSSWKNLRRIDVTASHLTLRPQLLQEKGDGAGLCEFIAMGCGQGKRDVASRGDPASVCRVDRWKDELDRCEVFSIRASF